eukprot:gnl/TRDRNA2_/TRDRNA2_189486_c0_seq1.p1 gnl/TRDRNA2_/TRDRNA2_189486_c0~~gnl/TRDRNA2_/TRDRNA2_189486_c0_seq1.p1  ORF type:complete len:407 (+),score=61.04 gnl/TRDRNA2_/TRDRNA2_189486_c0_seq1:74-1294(+)
MNMPSPLSRPLMPATTAALAAAAKAARSSSGAARAWWRRWLRAALPTAAGLLVAWAVRRALRGPRGPPTRRPSVTSSSSAALPQVVDSGTRQPSDTSVPIPDPTFGNTLGIAYDWVASSAGTNTEPPWEVFLGAFHIPKESPFLAHVKKLFMRPDIDEQFQALFDRLATIGGESMLEGIAEKGASAGSSWQSRRPCLALGKVGSLVLPRSIMAPAHPAKFNRRLCRADVERMSRGTRGHLHVLLRANERVPLAPASAEDHSWLLECFDQVFPPERPLHRGNFPAFAKLVLVRRVVRTLVDSVGLDQILGGMPAPLVVDIAIDLGEGDDEFAFRMHTVAPTSAPAAHSGERLALIEEAPFGRNEELSPLPSPGRTPKRQSRAGSEDWKRERTNSEDLALEGLSPKNE